MYQMPWVRFHSTKDYLDMLLVLREFPDIKQNFNLVPSLLYQIQDYAQNGMKDNIWELTEKPARELTADDKKEILSNFFLANITGMIKPYNRYYELYIRYKYYLRSDPVDKQLAAFTTEDYRDLQVWYNLCWMGMESRKRPEIDRLFKKGRAFSEEDKNVLLNQTREIMGEIIPAYKGMWESEQIELSTSPFYHPILPLVCDLEVAREASPSLPLPEYQFAHPEDAEMQVIKASEYFEHLFGRRPRGMWPSEGSVSKQALEIIARQGVEWVATDEGILKNTLKDEYTHHRIYQPYLLETGLNQIHIFFRDHYLSDAIGFIYTKWPAEKAVKDFIKRVHTIRQMLIANYGENSLDNHVVPVILDGENCWEFYDQDGKPFLRKLYQALSEDSYIQTVTLGEALRRNKNSHTLTRLHPGSWINSNFNIWIGAKEDNKAWDVLTQARNFLVNQQKMGLYSEEVLAQAWEKIYIAEGSDWNWWYGDEHSSANDLEFDQLYREHLMDVYRLLGHDVPTVLYQTIKHVHFDRFVSNRPKNFIYPVLDGRSTHFYEWVGAAVYQVDKTPQIAMHQIIRILDRLYIGFDTRHLYLRVDFLQRPDPLAEFVLAVRRPHLLTIVISPLRGVIEKFKMGDQTQHKNSLKPAYKLDKILEAAIPFEELEVTDGDVLGFQLQVKLSGQPIEEFPRINLIDIEVPGEDFEMIEWSV